MVDLALIETLTDTTGSSIAIGPDGRVIAVASTGTLVLLDGESFEHRVDVPDYVRGPVTFSSDGRSVFAGPWSVAVQSGEPTSRGLDIELLASTIEHSRRADRNQYSARAWANTPDGALTVASFVYVPPRGLGADEENPGPAGQVVLLDASAASPIAVLSALDELDGDPVVAIDTSHVVTGLDVIRVWDARDGSLVGESEAMFSSCLDLRLSPDGTTLAAVRVHGQAEVRSIADIENVTTFSAHSGRATAVTFHPRQPLLATGGEDRQVKLWSLDGSEPELVGWFFADADVQALAFHPHGQHLLIATDDNVLITELSGL